MRSKKFNFLCRNICITIFFRIFAVPNLGGSVPNCLLLNKLGEN